jgi:hypothetical protein
MMDQKMDKKDYIIILEKDLKEIYEGIKKVEDFESEIDSKIDYVYNELLVLYKYIDKFSKLKRWILKCILGTDFKNELNTYIDYLFKVKYYLIINNYIMSELSKKMDKIEMEKIYTNCDESKNG